MGRLTGRSQSEKVMRGITREKPELLPGCKALRAARKPCHPAKSRWNDQDRHQTRRPHPGGNDRRPSRRRGNHVIPRLPKSAKQRPGPSPHIPGTSQSRCRTPLDPPDSIGHVAFDYLTNWRLGVAQTMLRKGNSLKLIAVAVGYATALTRVFTQRVGMPSSEWLAGSVR